MACAGVRVRRQLSWDRRTTPLVGLARCAGPARVVAGGTNETSVIVWDLRFRRLTLRSATGPAQRAQPYQKWGSGDSAAVI